MIPRRFPPFRRSPGLAPPARDGAGSSAPRRGGRGGVALAAGLVLAVFGGLVPNAASAHAVYASLVPNPLSTTNSEGRVLPCITCHNNADGGAGCGTPPCLNPFGLSFRTNMFRWDAALAMLDADGDGFTNGQELQDAFGAWTEGPYPGVASLVTPPGNPATSPGDDDPDGDGYCAFGRDLNGDGDCRDGGENDGTFDCNESAASVHSAATEVCSNVGDDDCDGLNTLLDPECSMVVDRDGDGRCPMGIDMNGDRNCAGTGESSAGVVDCDDSRANVYVGARENCSDTVDNDCDIDIDLADGQCQGDADLDGDGYCPVGRDINGDGDCVDAGEVVVTIGDCDDENVAVGPDASETSSLACGDGNDNDCDGAADLNDTPCRTFADEDGDGYCPSGTDTDRDGDCTGATDLIGLGDCDDFNTSRNPGLLENCTETTRVDEDCDGVVNLADVGADGRAESTCLGYVDRDGDGYCFVGPDRNRDGDCVDTMEFGFSSDCDELSPISLVVNPTALEVCIDGVDNDCDGSADATDPACAAYRDVDRDGVCVLGRDLTGDFDCADADEQTGEVDAAPTDPTIYPGAPENCIDRRDNDQDGATDRDDAECTGDRDDDGDGYCPLGRDGNGDGDCLDDGEDSPVSDCNDASVDVGPTATELCANFRDDDCDVDVDLFDAACFYLLDRDRDGFCGRGVDDNRDGDCTDEAEDRFGEDCDDTRSAVNPNAVEDCENGRDDDCDRLADIDDTQCACTTNADCDDGDPCTVDVCRTAGRGCSYERALSCIDTGPLPDAGAADAGAASPSSSGCAASPRGHAGGIVWLVAGIVALVARRRRAADSGPSGRLSRAALAAALALVLCAPATARAYSTYAPLVPNGTTLGCLTCHNNSAGGTGCASPPCWNAFASAFVANGYAWNATLALGNADGDSWTNGQELLNPSGSWTTGSANPGPTSEARLPGFSTGWCGSTTTGSLSCAMNDCTLNYDNCDASPDACVETNPTFVCSCPSGYSGSGVGASGCANINECSTGNPCLEDSGFGNSCIDTTGSYTCSCAASRFTSGGTSCNDVNECSAGNPCLEDSVVGNTCTNATGRFECVCSGAGYQLVNDGGYPESCGDINECTAGNPCNEDLSGSPNSCSNLSPRYDCTCGTGYTLTNNGTFTETCTDNNECTATPGICGASSTSCTNLPGSYQCACASGYSAPSAGGSCTDVNECTTIPGVCGVNSTACTNTPGSYSCTCTSGYSFNGVTCVLSNACTADLDDCDPNATCTAVGASSWTCACLAGYSGNGRLPPPSTDTGCSDINECASSPCGSGTCTNLPGTYRCACPAGYTSPATGGTCTDVNECTAMPGLCGVGSCTNVPGTYRCGCPTGYSAPTAGGTCSDVDECAVASTCNALSGWGTCTNSVGGYSCSCAAGYVSTGTGFSLTCTNLDECTVAPPCGPGTCTDTIGSYRCSCPLGYTAPSVAGTCADVDECLDPSFCSVGIGYGTCLNTTGGFTCACAPGFDLAGSGRDVDCVNIDECAAGTDVCDAQASCTDKIPAFGGDPYTCACNAAYEGTGFACADSDECADPVTNDCSPLATCDNQVGTYGCTCNPGYEGNGFACTDVDECGRSPSPCGANETCINQLGAEPLCECLPGFARPEGGGACATACGNGLRVVGEECDDGNTTSGDGCSASCDVEAGWVCFEDGSASLCAYTCGDGVLDVLSGEECDDGAANSDTEADACRERCVAAACGDGVVDDGEECDDGEENAAMGRDACRPDCRLPFCGDGVLDEGEYCDRSTMTDADGRLVEQPIEVCTAACLPDGGPVDGGAFDAGSAVAAPSGCGCRVAGRRGADAGASGWLLVGGLMALVLSRRRR